jgi:nicotinate-nucleotide adenylyltransferase
MSSTARRKPSEPPAGILGGTFDPIHNAHLRLAAEAQRRFDLQSVIFIPAGRPWHRSAPMATPEHRLAMVRLAIADHDGFAVDDAEVRAQAPGYSVDTLERLRLRFGTERPLVLLLGADAFLGLANWHRWQTLFDLAHIAVATRPGHDLSPAAMPTALAQAFRERLGGAEEIAARPAGVIAPFPLSAGTVSSTEVRSRFAADQAANDLLPAKVVDYIRLNHLYLGD